MNFPPFEYISIIGLVIWAILYSFSQGFSINTIYIILAVAALVCTCLYLIINISPKVEHFIYAILFSFFLLISIIILLAFTGQTVWCGNDLFPMTNVMWTFLGFITLGVLNFNLVFRQSFRTVYDKLIILLLFYVSSAILVQWIYWSFGKQQELQAGQIVRFIKLSIIPCTLYVICLSQK